jgi:tetratricopeptide (TPR) repeat protein
MRVPSLVVCLTALALAGTGCRTSAPSVAAPLAAADPADDPCRAALAVVAPGPFATEIAAQQRRASDLRTGDAALEQLGYFFVARARLSHDDALYAAALATASCLERRSPSNDQARLLRGHVRHQQHRFAEAEALARSLVGSRGLVLDYALLGDALMEQGKLAEAADAYQRMIDLKPYYQSYTRAAHLRWLRGNLDGAIDLMRKAVASASPRDPESGSWARTRLADYYLQAKRFDLARAECDAVLAARPGYAAALLVRGRLELAQDRPLEAVTALRAAEAANPLPDVRWMLADALRAAHLDAEASAVERSLVQEGSLRDPRTLALYLSTRGESPDRAIDLARRELGVRGDVFTQDALAWALARAGRVDEAAPHMALALAEGTADARLFLHGGVIAAATGDRAAARRLLGRAQALAQTLLPSERAILAEARRAPVRLAGEGPRRSQERTSS